MYHDDGINNEVLVLHGRMEDSATTSREHLDAMLHKSKFKSRCLQIDPDATSLPDMRKYQAIIIHYSIALFSRRHISMELCRDIGNFEGFKGAFIQDEYRHIAIENSALLAIKPSCIFTCCDYDTGRLVYRPCVDQGTLLETVLTGYVTDEQVALELPSFESWVTRPVDIGYRARELAYRYGDLCRLKSVIGDDIRQIAESIGLVTDISNRDADRIYGTAWNRFLRSCKYTIVTESGCNAFDFSGELEDYSEKLMGYGCDIEYSDFRDLLLDPLDGLLKQNQISPRVFESVAMGALPVAVTGDYSGILAMDTNCIDLGTTVDQFRANIGKLKHHQAAYECLRAARKTIVENPNNHYDRLAETIDRRIDAFWERNQ